MGVTFHCLQSYEERLKYFKACTLWRNPARGTSREPQEQKYIRSWPHLRIAISG